MISTLSTIVGLMSSIRSGHIATESDAILLTLIAAVSWGDFWKVTDIEVFNLSV